MRSTQCYVSMEHKHVFWSSIMAYFETVNASCKYMESLNVLFVSPPPPLQLDDSEYASVSISTVRPPSHRPPAPVFVGRFPTRSKSSDDFIGGYGGARLPDRPGPWRNDGRTDGRTPGTRAINTQQCIPAYGPPSSFPVRVRLCRPGVRVPVAFHYATAPDPPAAAAAAVVRRPACACRYCFRSFVRSAFPVACPRYFTRRTVNNNNNND